MLNQASKELIDQYKEIFNSKLVAMGNDIEAVKSYKIHGRVISALGVVLVAYLPDDKNKNDNGCNSENNFSLPAKFAYLVNRITF